MDRIRSFAAIAVVLALVVAACAGDETATEPVEDVVTEEPIEEPVETASAETDTSTGGEGFIVQDGDLVEVHYVGTLDDGSQFDSSRDRGTPFSFTVGTGQVIAGFDEAVRGRQVGDVNTVRIEAPDAYGEWSEDNIVQVPFNPDQGDIAVGDEVYLNTGLPATILEITDEYVKLDANHPLAGEALTFEIEVLAVTRG